MTQRKGVLIAIGGAEDRGEEETPRLPYMSKGVLKHVLSQANGVDSSVVIVTSASSIPEEVAAAYFHGFGRLGCKDIKHHLIEKKADCDNETLMEDFRKADIVFFSGGNQSKLPIRIGKTALLEMLKDRYENDGLVIAGTSAGAMAMSQEMISGGSASEAFYKGAVKMRKGFGLIPKLIIDTHFVRRGRFGRLAEAVARNPSRIGIGLAEDTGVVIREGSNFRVIGSGMVIVMDPSSVSHNKYDELKEGTLLSLSNLTTHFLSNGDRFTIDDHSVEVLPVGEAYI